MPIDVEAARWAMRLILGRETPDEEEVRFHANGHSSVDSLRDCFFQTGEAKRDFRKMNAEFATYNIPSFLLQPPAQDNVPYRFVASSLTHPTSQMCTAEQMRSDVLRRLARKSG